MTKGSKIKFVGCSDEQIKWASNDDPRFFPALVPGEVYTIKKIKVHTSYGGIVWLKEIWLEETKGVFNSMCFEEVLK